jgi:hypothetical protein
MLCGMRGRFGGVGIDSVFGLGWFGWSWVGLIDRGDDSDLGFWDLFFFARWCTRLDSRMWANGKAGSHRHMRWIIQEQKSEKGSFPI